MNQLEHFNGSSRHEADCNAIATRRFRVSRTLVARCMVAALFATVAGLVSWRAQYVAHGNGSDHVILQRAAELLLDGQDPYRIAGSSHLPELWWRLFYPLPTVVLGMPFMWLSPEACAVAFVTCSAWLLGFAMTREGFDRIAVVASIPFLASAQFAQTGPIILAFSLLPAMRGLAMLKPNIGIAIFAWRPAWKDVAIAGTVFVASIVLWPQWPQRWLLTIRTQPPHHSPALIGVGAVCLLSILRWRRPEGRLLLAMTIVPHGLYFYDELPLFLIPSTRREVIALAITSWLGWLGWNLTSPGPRIVDTQPWVVASLYVPCLLMVLRRPNEAASAEPT